jgi:AcrR family transcriptional regulator
MPRTKQQNEQIRNATREKIQSAAMQLFVQKGFGSTNVQDIADLATNQKSYYFMSWWNTRRQE